MEDMNTIITGKIRTTYRKTGYVPIPGTERFVEIKDEQLNTALNFDQVEVEITKHIPAGDDQGRVTRIIKRNKHVFVGQIKELWDNERKRKEKKFVADTRGFYTDPDISNLEEYTDLDGKKIVLSLEQWDNPRHRPRMRITDILGNVGDNETEMQSAVIDRGLVIGFSSEIEQEAARCKDNFEQTFAQELTHRRDMRERLTFTIDPADAKDFDDALSVHTLDNGNYEIGIHIADPSFFVRPGTSLDDAAYERATSIYLVDRTIPMLPEVLSNDLCSLNPHEAKLTFSAVFEITPQAEIVHRWFGETVTLSDHRFTYQDAQAVLDAGAGTHFDALNILSDLATSMKQHKVAQGAIEFESKEVKFELDEHRFPLGVVAKERLWTMEIIEEFMLLANREVSRFVSLNDTGEKSNRPFIYRIHDKPKQEKITEAMNYLHTIGFAAEHDGRGGISSREINRILKAYRGSPLEALVSLTLLRSMNKATYSSDNIGHYGLAFKYYSHFTSPIRRYPDLMAHRLLRRYLAGEDVPAKEKHIIQKQAEHSSEMELKAVDAERESIRFKYAQLFSTKIGDELTGIVFKTTKYGILIEDIATKAEGMINVRAMGGDFYEFNEKTLTLKGRSSGRVFRVGDKVRAKVINADIEQKKIDFELVETKAEQ